MVSTVELARFGSSQLSPYPVSGIRAWPCWHSPGHAGQEGGCRKLGKTRRFRTQLVFLGRSQRHSGGYNQTIYTIDGQADEPSRFIGYNLARHHRADEVVILGTSGSMWDCLIKEAGGIESLSAADNLDLHLSVDNNEVDEEMLEILTPLVSESFGIPVRLQLVPLGRDVAEQTRILTCISEMVRPESDVYLDITHGLRHLPMTAMLAALHARAVQDVRIRRLTYATYFKRENETYGYGQLVDLSGAMDIASWVVAAESFRRTGNYGELAEVMKADIGADAAALMRRAAHFEAVMQFERAKEAVEELVGLFGHEGFPGASRLVEPLLVERLRWFRHSNLFEIQREAGRLALEKGDLMRATICIFEAIISRYMIEQDFGKLKNNSDRRDASELLARLLNRKRPDRNLFEDLRALRNYQAHAGSSPGRAQEYLHSPEKLEGLIKRAYKRFLSTKPLLQDQ